MNSAVLNNTELIKGKVIQVSGPVVDVQALKEAKLVKNSFDAVKILGNGNLTKKLEVKVNAFSASAKEKIEAAGGKTEVV